MTKETKALAKQGETGFAIVDDPNSREVMVGAFDQLGLSDFQLSRIKIPSGGMTAWEVEGLEGSTVEKHLDVILLAMKGKQKSWWATPLESAGGGAPPSCASTDGINGFGVNTLEADAEPAQHKCMECAWNQFGSARNGGKGKDCSDFALLYFFTKGSRLPSILTVPATSLKSLQNYVLRLIDAGKKMEGCVTRLALKKVQSASGVGYSMLDMSWQADLVGEDADAMAALSADFRKRLTESTPSMS